MWATPHEKSTLTRPTLLAGHVTAAQLWQIPLTYVVPFCVATWGALGANRC